MASPSAHSIPYTRPRPRYRVWDSRIGAMFYPGSDRAANPLTPSTFPVSGQACTYWINQDGWLATVAGKTIHGITTKTTDQVLPLFDTGLFGDPNSEQPVYEADIISFTIRGAAHGRDPDHCPAAHVWWCTEEACWAFGCWAGESVKWDTITGKPMPSPYTWWYTAADDGFDPSSVKVLGNVFQNPELVAKLGYTPTL